jgi:very-short-patch-repair endonuclease
MQQRTLITTRARTLRKAMSSPEVMLWARLRGREPGKPTFRRQHPFGSIILDFYCPSARLAVEVDGNSHWDEEAQRRDRMRDQWLEGQGVTVLRIGAAAIYRDAGGMAEAIIERAREISRSR